MTIWSEFNSWLPLKDRELPQAPSIGSPAPTHHLLKFPLTNAQPCILIFLRHCGCPFAEKTLTEACNLESVRRRGIKLMLVSQSDRHATQQWVRDIHEAGRLPLDMSQKQLWDLIIVDKELMLYSSWGLGATKLHHVVNFTTISKALKLGWNEGIWDRSTNSGSRWQTAGVFGVAADGSVQWVHIPKLASDLADLEETESMLMAGRKPLI